MVRKKEYFVIAFGRKTAKVPCQSSFNTPRSAESCDWKSKLTANCKSTILCVKHTSISINRILLRIHASLFDRPQEIDEAARRRLVKRLYIPLPDAGAREKIISSLLSEQKYSLTEQDLRKIVHQTQGTKWIVYARSLVSPLHFFWSDFQITGSNYSDQSQQEQTARWTNHNS